MDLRATLTATAVTLALVSCATPEACDPERLPNRGVADTPATLAAIVSHAIAHDCDATVRQLSSKASRDEWGNFFFTRMLNHDLELLGLEGATFREILKEGKFEGSYDSNEVRPGERIGIFFWRKETITPLLVPEIPEGRCPLVTPPEWRFGIKEQADRNRPLIIQPRSKPKPEPE